MLDSQNNIKCVSLNAKIQLELLLSPFRSSFFSNIVSPSIFRFGIKVVPPAENSRSAGADEGIVRLNSLKTFSTLR